MDKEILERLYCKEELTLKAIGEMLGCDAANISYWLRKYGIKKVKLTSVDPLEQWIYDNCFTQNGKFNNRVCIDTWWKSSEKQIKKKEIFDRVGWLDTDDIQIAIYHIFHDVGVGICKNCGTKTKFMQYQSGYREYCSVWCVTQSEERNRKIVENTDREKVQETYRKTCLERYGVEYFFESEQFKEKAKNTKLERYGDETYSNFEKNRQTCLERYGIEVLFNDIEFQKKARNSKLEKYGTSIALPFYTSKAEIEVLEYLNGLGFNFQKDRFVLGDLELDGYDKSLNTAVEYCGLFWHSERFKDKNYHIEKLKRCNELGIRLITIFEDEWVHRNKQVKQYLKASLGIFSERIYARDCDFVDIRNYGFFDDNHIQGAPNSIKYGFGLLNNGIIVGSVSFSTHHRKSNKLCLNRLAFRDGIQVIGGASKLIKNSLSILNTEIVTWSDNRWTDGELYERCGFVFDENLAPDYSYIDKKERRRISKQSSSKEKLGIPKEITEHQWHLDKGILRIYDCGKKRWLWKP